MHFSPNHMKAVILSICTSLQNSEKAVILSGAQRSRRTRICLLLFCWSFPQEICFCLCLPCCHSQRESASVFRSIRSQVDPSNTRDCHPEQSEGSAVVSALAFAVALAFLFVIPAGN